MTNSAQLDADDIVIPFCVGGAVDAVFIYTDGPDDDDEDEEDEEDEEDDD